MRYVLDTFFKILFGFALGMICFFTYLFCEKKGIVETDIFIFDLETLEKRETKRINSFLAEKSTTNNERNTISDNENKIINPSDGMTLFGYRSGENKTPTPKSPTEKTEEKIVLKTKNTVTVKEEEEEEEIEELEDIKDDKKTVQPKKVVRKKLNYAEIAKRPASWPKQIEVSHAGSQIPMFDEKTGEKIGVAEVPVGTKVFLKKVEPNGVLEVEGLKQVFRIHATRTTFRKIYESGPQKMVLYPAPKESETKTPSVKPTKKVEKKKETTEEKPKSSGRQVQTLFGTRIEHD